MTARRFWMNLGWLVVLVVTFAVPFTLDGVGRLTYFTSLTMWGVPIAYLCPLFLISRCTTPSWRGGRAVAGDLPVSLRRHADQLASVRDRGLYVVVTSVIWEATLAAVAGTLALVALTASLVPAYRASRLDPLDALRAE